MHRPAGHRPTRGCLAALALVALTLAGAASSLACSCIPGITLTFSFESATWVVVASVDSVRRQGDIQAVLTVEEQFKGPKLESFVLSKDHRLAATSCETGLAEGEVWLLFLRPSRDDSGTPDWPGFCAGNLAVKADRRADPERVALHLAALRAQQAEALAVPEDPWLFNAWAGATCWIQKPFLGPRASGTLYVRSLGGHLSVAAQFLPQRPSWERAAETRDLRVDIGGELHAIVERRDWPHQRGSYVAEDGAAALLLNDLQALDPPWLRLSLGGEFETEVGVYGLAAAVEKLAACREQEHLPHAGWLEVTPLGQRLRREPLRFSWSVAAATAPAKPIVADRGYGDWEELPAGDYIVSAQCYGEQQHQRVRVVEGKTERLTIRCGDEWPADD